MSYVLCLKGFKFSNNVRLYRVDVSCENYLMLFKYTATHTHTHTHAHTHARTHAGTHTHTHTCMSAHFL